MMSLIAEQPLNTFFPSWVTFGALNSTRFWQFYKRLLLNSTSLVRSMVVNEVQFLNAAIPAVVSAGSLTEVRLVHPANDFAPMVVARGMSMLVIPEQN